MGVVDIHNLRTDLVVEVLEVQEEEAYDHRVAVVDTGDILVLLAVVDNSEEDTVDAHNAGHPEEDEECIPVVVHPESVVRMSE